MPTGSGCASAAMRRRAVDRLVCDHLRIPRREARRWQHVPIEQEELVADGAVGLVRAAQNFDSSRGTPFAAYALLYVRGAILDTIRSRARRHSDRKGGFIDVVSLDAPLATGDRRQDAVDPRRTDEIAEDLERIRLLDGLPPKERYVLLRTQVDGASAAEVGVELGVTADRVYTLAAHGSTRLRKRSAS